jgi:hypothetical protein
MKDGATSVSMNQMSLCLLSIRVICRVNLVAVLTRQFPAHFKWIYRRFSSNICVMTRYLPTESFLQGFILRSRSSRFRIYQGKEISIYLMTHNVTSMLLPLYIGTNSMIWEIFPEKPQNFDICSASVLRIGRYCSQFLA